MAMIKKNSSELAERHKADEQAQSIKVLTNKVNSENKDKVSIDSVKGMLAQTATLCGSGKDLCLTHTIDRLLLPDNPEISQSEKAVIELQLLYGLRISEVLKINWTSITPMCTIRIEGLKGSCDRLVAPVMFKAFWLKMRTAKTSFPSSLNRFYFYRLYKKKGLYTSLGTGSNASVTHILRYNFISNLMNNNLNIGEIQQLLGHKSIISTLHYVDKLK